MLAQSNPYEAYQKVEFDARVRGANSFELVHVCYDQLIQALSTALRAHAQQDSALKSRSLTRALTALTALQMGVDAGNDMAAALTDFYNGARNSILANALKFDDSSITEMRDDFVDIREAMRPFQ